MGKRSYFERVARDFYPTPMEAVLPLLPHLKEQHFFIEPCAGDGALIRHLLAHGHLCVHKYDIEPAHPQIDKVDALEFVPLCTGDGFITNPPWDRKILHPLITHLSAIAPTWLLFDADWAHTRQAVPFLPFCRKIVSVGRVKWIPDSAMTGKDNTAWYLFDQMRTDSGTSFYGRPETGDKRHLPAGVRVVERQASMFGDRG